MSMLGAPAIVLAIVRGAPALTSVHLCAYAS
jgi:hypothetical protein